MVKIQGEWEGMFSPPHPSMTGGGGSGGEGVFAPPHPSLTGGQVQGRRGCCSSPPLKDWWWRFRGEGVGSSEEAL